MSDIRFAKGRPFPIELVSQRVAVMGTSGGGKSYGSSVLVEGMFDAGAQLVVVDPMGIWWGLRFAKDGKSPGLSIPVFGGDNGDIPLEPGSGELIARLVAAKGLSVVLDVSDMNETEKHRFVEAFARVLLKEKKRHRSPLMVVWEECDEFVPQWAGPREAPMLGAMQKLVKQGRNHGVGCMLISQRPQAVSKAALNQCNLLLAFQTSGPHELKAIKEWVVHQGADQKARLNELPSLQTGTCFVWSPAWLKLFELVHVLEKRTLDTGKPPELGTQVKQRALPPVDLDALRKDMAATIEKSNAEDPKLLRVKVAELEKRIASQEKDLVAARAKPPAQKRVEVPVLKDAQLTRLQSAVDKAGVTGENLRKIGELLTAAAAPITAALTAMAQPQRAPVGSAPALVRGGNGPGRSAPTPRMPMRAPVRETVGEGLDRYQQELLDALARLESLGRQWVDRRQMGALAGKSPRSSSFEKHVAALRARGMIEYGQGGTLKLTETGAAAAAQVTERPTGRDLAEAFKAHVLTDYQAKLLDVLVAADGFITREELATRAGLSHRSSSFESAVAGMKALDLVDYAGGQVAAGATIRLDGAA